MALVTIVVSMALLAIMTLVAVVTLGECQYTDGLKRWASCGMHGVDCLVGLHRRRGGIDDQNVPVEKQLYALLADRGYVVPKTRFRTLFKESVKSPRGWQGRNVHRGKTCMYLPQYLQTKRQAILTKSIIAFWQCGQYPKNGLLVE